MERPHLRFLMEELEWLVNADVLIVINTCNGAISWIDQKYLPYYLEDIGIMM